MPNKKYSSYYIEYSGCKNNDIFEWNHAEGGKAENEGKKDHKLNRYF
jgi:hypothetical protein